MQVQHLHLIKHHALKAYGGIKVYFHTFLISESGELYGQYYPPAVSSPRKEHKVGRASELVWTQRRRRKFLLLPGIEPRSLGLPSRSLITVKVKVKVKQSRYRPGVA